LKDRPGRKVSKNELRCQHSQSDIGGGHQALRFFGRHEGLGEKGKEGPGEFPFQERKKGPTDQSQKERQTFTKRITTQNVWEEREKYVTQSEAVLRRGRGRWLPRESRKKQLRATTVHANIVGRETAGLTQKCRSKWVFSPRREEDSETEKSGAKTVSKRSGNLADPVRDAHLMSLQET